MAHVRSSGSKHRERRSKAGAGHRGTWLRASNVLMVALGSATGCHFGTEPIPLGYDTPSSGGAFTGFGSGSAYPRAAGGAGGGYGPAVGGIGSGGNGLSPGVAGTTTVAGGGGASSLGGASSIDGGGDAEMLPACDEPPDLGPCDAFSTRYSYDPVAGCVELAYGGCEGNANNFRSMADCVAACASFGPAVVIEADSCAGFGRQVTTRESVARFSFSGTFASTTAVWECGCPERPEYVMTYTPSSPIQLRLCHDDRADPCVLSCSDTLTYDLASAYQAAGTTEVVFAD